MLRLKTGPNLPGPIFPTLHIFFVLFFYLNNYSLRDPPLHTPPEFFIFRDPISRLTFATPFRDSHSRPHFATRIRDLISQLTFATRVRGHTRDSR